MLLKGICRGGARRVSTYLSTMSLCPCFSVRRRLDSKSRRLPSTRLRASDILAASFVSVDCCNFCVSDFH